MKSLHTQVRGILLVFGVAAGVLFGITQVSGGGFGAPVSTPDPSSVPERDRNPPVQPADPHAGIIPGTIKGDQPLPFALPITVGGKSFTIPKGATTWGFISGLPAVDIQTGETIGDFPTHPSYTAISRGQSIVKIDQETGEVFEWNVQPADEADFDGLRP
jgi:hypothetical protein